MNHSLQWLEWAQRLQALSQSGLTYSTNPFEIERYHAISEYRGRNFCVRL